MHRSEETLLVVEDDADQKQKAAQAGRPEDDNERGTSEDRSEE
jgi:hypothetical protein